MITKEHLKKIINATKGHGVGCPCHMCVYKRGVVPVEI